MPIVRRRSLLMGSLAATVGAPAIVQAQAERPSSRSTTLGESGCLLVAEK